MIHEQDPLVFVDAENINPLITPGDNQRVRIIHISWRSTSTSTIINVTNGNTGVALMPQGVTASANTVYVLEFGQNGFPCPKTVPVRIFSTPGTINMTVRYSLEDI